MVQRKPPAASSGAGRRDRRDRSGADRSARERIGPVRTCVGCRQRAEASELVRVAAREGDAAPVLTVDLAKTMPGRGAWVHPRADCVSTAVRRRAFSRALRQPRLVVDPDGLLEAIGAERSAPAATDGPQGPEQVAEA